MNIKNSFVFGSIFLILFCLTPLRTIAQSTPAEFMPPPLHPEGALLETKELAPQVYALVSNKPGVDNSGFIVGERGVLVIDSHINGAMAKQILAAVRKVTNKPVLYLINTNYHGDHTFGNYAFPAETLIVAHRHTAERMHEFEQEKQFLLPTVKNDPAVFADVRLRLPDVVFEDHLRLDLGGRVVELHHFGAGNTPGDTVVYVPEGKIAWTGNLILGEGTIPFLIEGGAGRYLETVARLAQQLDVDTIVPGHGPLTSGATIGRYAHYLNELLIAVRKGIRSGKTPGEIVAANSLGTEYLPAVSSEIASASSQLPKFVAGIHSRNVWITYQELNGNAAPAQARTGR